MMEPIKEEDENEESEDIEGVSGDAPWTFPPSGDRSFPSASSSSSSSGSSSSFFLCCYCFIEGCFVVKMVVNSLRIIVF
jgi:hypothetical protein